MRAFIVAILIALTHVAVADVDSKQVASWIAAKSHGFHVVGAAKTGQLEDAQSRGKKAVEIGPFSLPHGQCYELVAWLDEGAHSIARARFQTNDASTHHPFGVLVGDDLPVLNEWWTMDDGYVASERNAGILHSEWVHGRLPGSFALESLTSSDDVILASMNGLGCPSVDVSATLFVDIPSYDDHGHELEPVTQFPTGSFHVQLYGKPASETQRLDAMKHVCAVCAVTGEFTACLQQRGYRPNECK